MLVYMRYMDRRHQESQLLHYIYARKYKKEVKLYFMLIQNHLGGADVSGGYEIRLETLIPVIIAIVGYLLFLVKGGKKGLKEIIDAAYADEKDEVE